MNEMIFMNILILGASGFLGGVLYKKIQDKKCYNLLGTYNNTINNKNYVHLNILNKAHIENLFHRFSPNVIIWSLADRKNEDELTEYGLKYLLEFMPNDCKIIYLSTNVFNDGVGNKKETDPPNYHNDGHDANRYVQAKIKAEKILEHIRNHVIVRPGIIYGKGLDGKWDKRISKMINSVTNGEIVKISKNRLATWVDVGDLSEAIILLLQNPFTGIIHIGSDQRESGYSVNKKIAKTLGLDAELIQPLETDDNLIDNSYNLILYNSIIKNKKINSTCAKGKP